MSFGEADSDGRQALRLHALRGDEAREDSVAGTSVLEGWTGQQVGGSDARIWAGRIADSFYIDLSLLDVVNAAVRNGGSGPVGVALGRGAEQLRRHDRRPPGTTSLTWLQCT